MVIFYVRAISFESIHSLASMKVCVCVCEQEWSGRML